MPYEIELGRDTESGLDRYTISVGSDFDSTQAHKLGDWLAAAAQNPTAAFTIDLRCAQDRPVSVLLARSSWLREHRRVEVVRRRPVSPA